MDCNFSTEEVFNSAVSIVRNLPKEGPIKPSDELKLKFYSYFKQATYGPNDTPKPSWYQIVEKYKWDAWRKLGDMSKEEAMLNYIKELKQIMESIPEQDTDSEDIKPFEDILGKKFYDYWFSQWEQSVNRGKLIINLPYEDGESSHEQKMVKSNDSQSNSSNGSSMSMLEDTQSAGEGYKTPNSLVFRETFSGEVGDQFAAAVLRLQHGLEETVTRIENIEGQLKQSIDRICFLENQTHAKQLPAGVNIRSNVPKRSSNLSIVLRSIKTVHWFYLIYPFFVYYLIRILERRRRNNSSR